jgi:hypothetical protein
MMKKHFLRKTIRRSFLIAAMLMVVSITTLAAAVKHYRAKDFLYVFAPSGLSIRDAASTGSVKVGFAPFAARVQALKNKGQPVPISLDNISGNWTRVKFESVVGYMFDGYLCHFPPPTEGEGLVNYAKRAFGKPISNKTVTYPERANNYGTPFETTIKYSNGVKIVDTDDGAAYGTTLFLPKGRLIDGFLIARLLGQTSCLNQNVNLPSKSGEMTINGSYTQVELTKKYISLYCDNDGMNMSIKKLASGVISILFAMPL